ncbi:hypothetical protein M0802_014198 [Mischocyttarus mexicanus]|nr:hypothetical protein M0802_014198 [Mischocyttarus mexicanus]
MLSRMGYLWVRCKRVVVVMVVVVTVERVGGGFGFKVDIRGGRVGWDYGNTGTGTGGLGCCHVTYQYDPGSDAELRSTLYPLDLLHTRDTLINTTQNRSRSSVHYGDMHPSNLQPTN